MTIVQQQKIRFRDSDDFAKVVRDLREWTQELEALLSTGGGVGDLAARVALLETKVTALEAMRQDEGLIINATF